MRGSGARLVTTAIVPDSRFPFPQSLQKSGNSNREVHRLSRFRNHQTACSCLIASSHRVEARALACVRSAGGCARGRCAGAPAVDPRPVHRPFVRAIGRCAEPARHRSRLASHAHRLYHRGARAISRSTLADANAKRPSEALGALFAHLVAQAGRGLRRKIGEAVHLIDSTGLRLSNLSADWRVSRTASAGRSCTSSTIATPSARSTPPSRRLNDITAAQALPIAAGAT